jgi:drug/metabolite transporter (DMT)-like permease
MRKTKSFLCLLMAQFMVAASIVTNKILLSTMPLLQMLGFRFFLAGLMCLPILLFNFKILKNLSFKDWGKLTIQALLGGAFFNLLMYGGLEYTTAIYAGLMSGILPFLILVLSYFLLRERLNAKQLIAILIASMGVFFIHYHPFNIGISSQQTLGTGLIFLALLIDGLYYIYCKQFPVSIPSFLGSAVTTCLNFFFFLPAFLIKPFNLTGLTPQIWGLLFLMGLSLILFYLFWLNASQAVSGYAIAISTAFAPLATIVLSVIFLSESLSLNAILGMLLIMLALITKILTPPR